jgi:hypothetical protein
MTSQAKAADPTWPEAMATVLSCKYEFGAGQALAFGVPSSKHFLITFNYWANGELHTGEYTSATAVPQGHLFPITYNPAAPHEHSQSSDARTTRSPIFAIGITGSIILAIAWLAIMRGCR